ncbi:MAG: ATP-binding cassette, subfamily bacterial [Sphingomonadales bacterium]|nr:ATP-binding cassette, subfamily bacterial [Sphingomonadales bacterium]
MSRAEGSGVAALLKDYRGFAGGRLGLALALMFLGALAEGFGLLMIVPLAMIAINGGDSHILRFAPWAAGWSVERRFMVALGLFLGAMAARSLLLVARDSLLARLNADYEADLRLRAAATLASRGWPFASRIGQAGMQSLLLNDVPRASQAAAYVQSMAVGATMLMIQLTLTFVLSPTLTLVAIAFLAAASLVSLRFTRRGVRSGMAIVDAMEESAGSGFRLHAGLKAALAQGTVPAFLAEYSSSLRRAAGQFAHFARDYSVAQQLASFGAALVAAVLLLVGVRVLMLPFPVLITSLILFARMSAPAQLLQNSAVRAAAHAPAFAAIDRRLGPLDGAVPSDRPRERLEWSELELDEAGYEHEPGLGLGKVSLRLRRGEWLGISGASASGKTTLVDLVAGLLLPQTGAIRLDGRPLDEEALERWRGAIAYVGQEGSVFNDTVRGNLLAEGASVDEVSLWQALETVGLGSRVRAFASGLNESVGDRGSQLSGGERQRLVLARALLRRPSLLILDEATAALDPEGEASLIERLKALEPRPAALVVAHRPSTLVSCDFVMTIQHGTTKSPSSGTCAGETTASTGSPRLA